MNKLVLMANTIDSNIKTWARSEKGQGSIEYIGIAVIAGLIIAGIVTLFTAGGPGITAITDGIQGIIDGIFGDSAY